MMNTALYWPAIVAQLTTLGIVAVWLVGTVIALVQLRQRQLDRNVRLVWLLLIVCVPLLGTLAFFLVQPARNPMHP